MRQSLLLYSIVLLLAAAPLSAAETRIALTIGNSAYLHTAPLPNPRRDAQAMAAALQALGFKVIAGYDLDYNATKDLLRRFGSEASGADVALFYYAGHAVQVDGQNYLLPVDTRLREEGDLKYESYPLDWAMQELGRARKLRLAILDACRDNPLAQTMARSMGARGASVERGLARIEAPSRDTLIAYATRAGSTADDGRGDHSPYTAALLAHIATPGVDVIRMFGLTRDTVLAATDNRQEPYIYGSLGGESWSFVPKSPESGADALAYWDRIADSHDPAVLRAFIARFPDDPVMAARARERIAVIEANRTMPPELIPYLGNETPQTPSGSETAPVAPPVQPAVPATAEESALSRSTEIPVRFIQLALKDLGHYRGPIDGTLGASSRTAISVWQSSQSLKPTGRLDPKQKVSLLVEAADSGRPQSQNILGMMRASGIGLPKDAVAAREWFERSAAQGNAYASFNLGVLYRDGLGVAASTAKARDYFEQARRGGHAEAAKALARLR
jgi:peptidoglycan hydrolase-like protein with peptidoglycan-binding domain